jgi:hypothetical protein
MAAQAAIHVLLSTAGVKQDVDGRDKHGHNEERRSFLSVEARDDGRAMSASIERRRHHSL